MSRLPISLLSAALLLGGCSLIPDYQRPASPSAAQYPQGPAYAAQSPVTPRVEDWRALFNDPALQQLIESALVNNRDLRVAALNVEAFQAQYRIQRADLLPAVSANANELRQRVPSSVTRTKAAIRTATAIQTAAPSPRSKGIKPPADAYPPLKSPPPPPASSSHRAGTARPAPD